MTKIFTIVRRRPVTVVVSAVCLATALGAGLRLWATPRQGVATAPSATAEIADAPDAKTFEQATASVSWRLESLSPQYLFPSMPKADRTSAIVVGRADPYSPLIQGRITPQPSTTPTAAVNTTVSPTTPTLPQAVATAPTALPPIPTSIQPLAPLPPILPTATVPALPVAAPTATYASPIDTLELTGVVQLGDRPALIVREPNAATSRYTYAGEYLAGGQILIKQIDVSHQEPLVILEYNGREYSRMVGSGPVASLR